MLRAYDVFIVYMAIKLHFTQQKYNAITYNFKVNRKSCSPSQFEARRDKRFFERLSFVLKDRQEVIEFFVAHFANDVKWVGDMALSTRTKRTTTSSASNNIYTKWKGTMDSLSYIIKTDLLQFEGQHFDDVLCKINIEENGLYPPIVTQYLAGQLSLETIAFVEKMTGFIEERVDKEITDTMLWSDHSLKIRKYAHFIPISKEEGRKLILQVFRS